jgi:2-aminoadipate transaminase
MRFAKRTERVHRSYIREILKVTADPEIISFAGGLPNPATFPVEALSLAIADEMAEAGTRALQYATTEGDPGLRGWIAARYRQTHGLDVDPDEIIITGGSQQGLDLAAKVFLDEGDRVVIERPGYLGAIQCFSYFGVEFSPVSLGPGGVDLDELSRALAEPGVKLFYAAPTFQNPSGVSYDEPTRKRVAEMVREAGVVLVEDNPYGELRYLGEDVAPIRKWAGDACVLFGSFSKIAAPGLRIGWVWAPREAAARMVTAKQATDLHTSIFVQRALHRWLSDNDLDAHVASIRDLYGAQRDVMVAALGEHFPDSVSWTEPEGGMFLWVRLPEGASSVALFELAISEKVAFVPGTPFYVDGGGTNTLRLNFSNASPDSIREGMARLGSCLRRYLDGLER